MASGYSVAITATDQATAVIDRINARFGTLNKSTAQVTAAGQRFGASLSRFGQVSGLNQVSDGMARVSRSIGGAVEGLGRFAPALAGVTGAASIAGIARLTMAWSEFGSRLGIDARRIGIAASSLHTLQGASRLAGGSAEGLTDGLQTLGDNLVNAVGGRAPEFVVLMNTLGVSFRNARTGGARLAEDVLPEIADRIAAIRNPTLQARAAVMAFGGAGETLLPFLQKGAKGLAEYNAAARTYGVQNGVGVEAARAFREEHTRLSLAVEGVGYSVSQRLAPVLMPMLRGLSDWVAANRGRISDGFGEMAARFGAWQSKIDWEKINSGLQQFGEKVQWAVGLLGGWGQVAQDVGVVLAIRFLAPVMGLTAALGRFALMLGTTVVESYAAATAAALGFNATLGAGMKLGGAAAGLGAAGLGWWATNELRKLMQPKGDGIGNLLTNMLTDTNPMHWTQSYHPPETEEGARGNGWQRHAPSWLGGNPGGPVSTVPLEPGARARNATEMGAVLQGEGRFTREASAALLGGGIQESGLNPRSGAGSAHQGIFQWDGERRAAIEAQFRKPLTDMTPAEQARAAIWEIDNNPRFSDLRTAFRSSHHLETLNRAATQIYEAPGNYGVEVPRRLGLSQGVLAADVAKPAPNVAPAPAPGGAGAPGASGSVDLNVYHHNPPAGLRSEVNTRGDVTYNGPRVDGAMAVP